MISEDIESDNSDLANVHSAMAVAFTIPQRHGLDGFVNLEVMVFGDKRIDQEASSLLAGYRSLQRTFADAFKLGHYPLMVVHTEILLRPRPRCVCRPVWPR